MLEDEIKRFLEGEKLTDIDLRQLDEKIRVLLNNSNAHDNLKRNLSNEPYNPNLSQGNNSRLESQNNVYLPDLNNDNMSVRSKVSRKSQKSNKSVSKKARSVCSDYSDLESVSGRKRDIERFDFDDQKDEWNAIVAYNKRLFDDENRQNKQKDMEVKKRIREDLDNQIRQKKNREYDEIVKNRDYDEIIKNHCYHLEDLEMQKKQEIKERIMKEKENRDKQLREEKKRKKVEYLKEKKYDKEIVKNLLGDIEKDKEKTLKKKVEEKELL